MENVYNEYLFMSYRSDLAGYHLKRLKRYIEALPECYEGYHNNTQSEQTISYDFQGKDFVCEPEGVLAFKRGKHPKELLADDILRDPDNYIDLSSLEKIKKIYFEEVEQMPKDKLHVVGTPQDREDLFNALAQTPTYDVRTYPTPVNLETHEVVWKEMYPWERLEQIRLTIGDKAFNKEFRCMPVRSTEAFVSIDKLDKIINPNLHNYDLIEPIDLKGANVVGGFDIGKKTHPSHLSVFRELKIEEGGKVIKRKLIQIHSKFMDGWEYQDQIEYLRQAIKHFNICKLDYDNSRSEFEECAERGELPEQMEPVSFGAKANFTMAVELDKAITNFELELLDDGRQKRQILSLDCDLRAPTTVEGHGDSFWSLCLVLKAYKESSGILVWSLGR